MNLDSLYSVEILVLRDIIGHTFFISKCRNIFFFRKSIDRRSKYRFEFQLDIYQRS